MPHALKFAVVGQGIAGTVLSLELIQRGAEVKAFDIPNPSSASRVAAGMWNPVSFKTLKPLWNAAAFCDSAREFYSHFEEQCQQNFYYEIPMHRIFNSVMEANDWTEKSLASTAQRFMHDDDWSHLKSSYEIPHGTGCVHGSGWLNTHLFLNEASRFIDISRNGFTYSELDLSGEKPVYHGEEFDHIIFCEGTGVLNNPWFSYLPVRPNKGQVLTVELTGEAHQEIIHFGHFLLPTGNGVYRLGATYEGDLPAELTDDGRQLLEKDLARVSKRRFSVTGHKAGLRPTVPDRRPICGPHPERTRLSVFNGFGSRGVLYAPWCAMHMSAFLLEGTSVPGDISTARYRKYLTT
jgi:glycine/D-amino acid oxidase-like deaminating enzyme